MAMSRLFSSASATASSSDKYILPSRMTRSIREELVKLGGATLRTVQTDQNFGSCDWPRVKSWSEYGCALCCGAGACGIGTKAFDVGTGAGVLGLAPSCAKLAVANNPTSAIADALQIGRASCRERV